MRTLPERHVPYPHRAGLLANRRPGVIASNAMRHSRWLLAALAAAAPALAQNGVALPIGQNLHVRPDQNGDVVLTIDGAGAYALNGQPIAASQLAGELPTLIGRTRDRVVYVRADARLSAAAI